jgi:hypothetical protein
MTAKKVYRRLKKRWRSSRIGLKQTALNDEVILLPENS